MKIPKGNIESIYALSPMQEGILFHCIHAPGSGLYVEQYSCALGGPLDVTAFERAWDDVVERHQPLRTLFTWERRSKPLQVVRGRVSVPWRHEDWRHLSSAARDRRLSALMVEERRRGFRLDRAPLMRFHLVRTADDAFHFVWTFHHLLLDGWSMRLVLRDVFESYAARRRGQEPPTRTPRPFEHHIAWLRSQNPSRAEAVWKEHLGGFDSPTPLGIADVRRPRGWAERHGDLEIHLTRESTTALTELARSRRLTLNTLLRGAWALLLSRYSDRDDVVFGATVSGRTAELEGIEEMVGLFINTIPVRVQVPEEAPLARWLEALQVTQHEMTPHELTPLADIQRWSEVRGQPLFQSLLVIENHRLDAASKSPIPDLQMSGVRFVEQSNYPLALLVVPGEQLRMILVYDRDRFEPETVKRVGEHLREVLSAMVRDPDRHVGAISILPESERRRIVDSSQGEAIELPDVCVHDLVARWSREAADRPAVVCEGSECSYRQLDERTNRLAARLLSRGVGPGDCVGVAIPRSIEMIEAIIGVLRAGGAYVPLEPGEPADRVRLILEETRARVLLTTRASAHLVPDVTEVVLVDEPEAVTNGAAPPRRVTACDLAYVIFTSGTTGRPKGVAVTHRNLVHSTCARERVYGTSAPRFCLLSPHVFDSSVAGIFWTLCSGGTLVLPAPGSERDLPALVRLIEAERVTHTLLLPSLYALLVEHADPASLRSLETVVVAGEACSRGLVTAHHAMRPHAKLYNEYGPTEATVWSTVQLLERDDAGRTVPIGRPIPGTTVHVLDRRGEPSPLGVEGEMHIGGGGVARGYMHDPELTRARFVDRELEGRGRVRLYRTGDRGRLRADGALEFLGRMDTQIKLRGHRIELEEIEAVVKSFPAVRDAVAVLAPPPSDRALDRLIALAREVSDGRAAELLDEAVRSAPAGGAPPPDIGSDER